MSRERSGGRNKKACAVVHGSGAETGSTHGISPARRVGGPDVPRWADSLLR